MSLPTWVPPLPQRPLLSRAAGPQRKNWSVPVQFCAPVMVRLAESWTDVPGVRLPPGVGVVTRPLSHLPNPPRTKSFKVAVVEVDERVSDATLEKHSPPRPSSDRL